MIELMDYDYEYCKNMLASDSFNEAAIVNVTKISRFYLNKIKASESVKPYITKELAEYFKSINKW